jgi:hypothetical protein
LFLFFQSHSACDTELSASAAPQADFRIDTAVSGQNVLLDDSDGALGAVEKTSLASSAGIHFDPGFLLFFVFPFFGRTIPFGIDDGSPGAGIKTGSAVGAEEGVNVEANFNLTFNGVFRAFFGACAAPLAIATDLMSHKISNPDGMRCSGADLI